ncbi:MAG: rod shape-determining protein RodA [Bacteroidetes bacterium 4572_117]|nr:MAG: rod shape-determining protein RodA [Bacteroidetes bacterium 4572_117]
MRRTSDTFGNIDWITVLIYFILVLMGWANIYAAVYNEAHVSIFDISQRYGKQLLWISVAFILIVAILLIESKFYEYFAYLVYLAAIILLIAVLLFGKEIHGARSWFEFGPIRFQPAEFTKLATALALARFLSTFGISVKKFKDLAIAGAIIILPAALIILQNDTGSALVYASFIIVFYREGLWTWIVVVGLMLSTLFISVLLVDILYVLMILPPLAILIFYLVGNNRKTSFFSFVILVLFVFLFSLVNYFFLSVNYSYIILASVLLTIITLSLPAYKLKVKFFGIISAILISSMVFSFSVDYLFSNILEKHQRTRINVLLGLEKDPSGVGYNVNQSEIAIGSGGVFGKGYLQGTQTKYDFVPEQDTDFIFCTVGEEWGFLGTTVVISLFLFLLLRLIYMAERQKSNFSRLYGYGVAAILFFHIIINIGMTIGLAPVIGIPLPFFSYGGSSLWAFTILLFIFIRLDASRKEQL